MEDSGSDIEGPARRPSSDVLPKTDSDGYQIASGQPPQASEEPLDSAGYQIGSDQPAPPEQAPEQRPDDDDHDEDVGIDPYDAYAQIAAKVAAEEKCEKERRDPPVWLPGPDDLDQDGGPTPDQETGFSRDRWRRGNPQVSVRLRPHDFESLRRAADLYGVRPTTLARMMVIRGVRAIL